MSDIYGTLPLIDGEVYVDKEHISSTWRYVGELTDSQSMGYCTHVFRSCKNGRLWSIPYTTAEKQLRLFRQRINLSKDGKSDA